VFAPGCAAAVGVLAAIAGVGDTEAAIEMSDRQRRPLWLFNLLFFGLLILVVLAYFLWQANQVKKSYYRHTREHSQLLARITRLNLDNALAADQAVKQAARTFMQNSARFIDYLAAIEPFTSDELTNLALESGLCGITIKTGSQQISGPPHWLAECGLPRKQLQERLQEPGFSHLPNSHIFILGCQRREDSGFILLGFGAQHLEKLQRQVGLKHLLKTLNQVPGIAYVRVVPGSQDPPREHLKELKTTRGMVIESRLPLGNRTLIAGFNSNFMLQRERALWRHFFAFATLLGGLGLLASLLLYRLQLGYLQQVRGYEQHLARERENALLGRATAALAHEIRNPLNAISIGLQRLEIEECGLNYEYAELIGAMRKAVARADSIVNNLKRFSRPLKPRLEKVDIAVLLKDILALYRLRAEAAGIEIEFTDRRPPGEHQLLPLDTDLMAQVCENLCKNAIEAQPEGGFLKIDLHSSGRLLTLRLENQGLTVPADEVQKIVTPWFTTKTRGTGLGLALVERIIHAHRGRFTVSSPAAGVLRQEISLPTTQE
jgi:signal transduction histidine kinase